MSQTLIYDKRYIESLKKYFIILDNTYLVDLSKDESGELLDFLELLQNNDCIVVTIKDVFREFVRGAKSTTQYKKFIEILKNRHGEIRTHGFYRLQDERV